MQNRDLNQYPQPALLAGGSQLAALNEKARTLFPALKPGGEVPDVLLIPKDSDRWEGCVTLEGRMYRAAATRDGEQTLYLLQPQEQTALGEAQLDGAVYQVRTLMGEFRRQLAPYVAGEKECVGVEDMERFSKSYYRMLRLIDHMDLLRDAAAEQLHPARERLDLDRLCAVTAMECHSLLGAMSVSVDYEGANAPVFVTGDEGLLRTAVLELISNCAKRRRGGGRLSLRLTRKGKWISLCVTDDGGAAGARERLGLTTRGAMPLIPVPDAGAGLGLSVVETILRLHGGSMLVSTGPGAPSVYLILPAGERTGDLSVHAPRPERGAGMNPYLIALSDVLGGDMIREDWKQ